MSRAVAVARPGSRRGIRRTASVVVIVAAGFLGTPIDVVAQEAGASDEDRTGTSSARGRPLPATALISAAGGGLGLAAGLAATDALTEMCELCLSGYVLTFGGNVAGAATGGMLAGADGSQSVAGALLGFGTGVATVGFLDSHRASREAQITAYLLVQGLTTALVDRYADELLRAIRW